MKKPLKKLLRVTCKNTPWGREWWIVGEVMESDCGPYQTQKEAAAAIPGLERTIRKHPDIWKNQ